MTLTVFAMMVVIVWAIRTICKELDLGGVLKERLHSGSKEKIE